MLVRFVAVAAAALSVALPGMRPAVADPQPAPTPVTLPSLPPDTPINPYAKAAIDIITGVVRRRLENDPNRAEGEVTYFRRFDLQVRTGPDAYRNVRLHQGTRIDPRGATIQAGDRVSVGGSGLPDGSLDADAITILH
jgi:hypothetical protein